MPADRIYFKNLFNITNPSTYFDTEILSAFEPRVLKLSAHLILFYFITAMVFG
jgi:hypothetical protein